MTTPLIVMVGADKGGVGKTTVCRALIDYIGPKSSPFRVFDSEYPKGGLKRFALDANVVDLERIEGQMITFDTLAGVTVIDVRAGLLSRVLQLLDRAHLLNEVKGGTVNLALLHVIGPSAQSLGEIPEMATAIGGGAKHFLVKNFVSETAGYFAWEGPASKLGTALAHFDAQTITVPHLEDRIGETIDRLGASFAGFSRDPNQSRMLRGLARSWLDQVWNEFDKIGLGLLAQEARTA